MLRHYEALLAAERRGRALVERLKPEPGVRWSTVVVDDADGHALLAACRLAGRLGAAASVRLDGPVSTTVGKLLIESSRRQGILAPEPGDGGNALTIADTGQRHGADAVPDDSEAWRTPLADAPPLVAPAAGLPAMSCAECRGVDGRAIADFLVPGLCLMENAAIAAAIVAMDMLEPKTSGILVAAGGGNNGGDGLAMARGLSGLGVEVDVALFKDPARLSEDAAANLGLLRGLPAVRIHRLDGGAPLPPLLEGKALIVDALLGTGFTGAPSPLFRDAMEAVNASGVPVLALDLPSGLNGDTGEAAGAAIRAARTVTFAAVKTGLYRGKGAEYAGALHIGDIGAPTAAFPESWRRR